MVIWIFALIRIGTCICRHNSLLLWVKSTIWYKNSDANKAFYLKSRFYWIKCSFFIDITIYFDFLYTGIHFLYCIDRLAVIQLRFIKIFLLFFALFVFWLSSIVDYQLHFVIEIKVDYIIVGRILVIIKIICGCLIFVNGWWNCKIIKLIVNIVLFIYELVKFCK